jgi:hypothetical protein
MTDTRLAEFEEDTAYESLVLTSLSDVRQMVLGRETEARDNISGANISSVRAVSDTIGAGAASAAVEPFRGLVFGAAYKVLDLAVELVIGLSLPDESGSRWTLKQKQDFVPTTLEHSILPAPLDDALWSRLAVLYDRLLEPRHALVHRRVTVDADGNLQPHDRDGRALAPISAEQIESFALAMYELREAVIGGDGSVRRLNALRWHLDALDDLHGLPRFGASEPAPNMRIIEDDLERLGDERWRIDVEKIANHLARNRSPPFADLVLRAPREAGGDLFFGARYEELPPKRSAIEFSEVDLPPWLRPLSLEEALPPGMAGLIRRTAPRADG